ncbi:M3 family oligoendopeptidase [Oceanobacillus alkalisoli]|uniref:M3 family oligoendopeptidase n=1 Tax=Oceanobacillus alkalisoli TaxID=2925113 RepID=UPI001EE4D365|nr:M3 family oligoendopeptidase [Oceanobacillus alkalisoli]MCG5105275.1 M3 family oligoendopeptidase [Oceanobacillus alkalisoli]
MKEYNPTWDLDSLFTGGSASQEFRNYLNQIQTEIKQLEEQFITLEAKSDIFSATLTEFIKELEETLFKIREAGAFVSCLSAQDVMDEGAHTLVAECSALSASFNGVLTTFMQKLAEVPETEWQATIQHEALLDIGYVLTEYRNKAQDLLAVEQEVLINDLAVDGYHAWNQMYSTIVGNMKVEIEGEEYSIGQASNLLNSSKRATRKQVFDQLNDEWKEQASLFAQTLNHLAGFRLQMYKHRNWENVLKEPLSMNRMKQETLDAMWTAIANNKQPFVTYLNKKAEQLHLDKLSFYDVDAPITDNVKKVSYTEGANFIIEQFRSFSPKMADFAEQAFEKRWIEAEDRPGKRPGGFCTSFPDSKETRIFMTYSETASNIATLAHELGHAYHQHIMNDIHGLNQRYAMNVAETASTFAEMIVADAAVEQAETTEEKKALLEEKVSRSVAFFMNIHARFIFELNFYKEREKGFVSPAKLNELMVEAQKEAYQDSLDEYDPYFWASKLHFHITGTPFYNFPYTFGYLFSLGIYARAKEQGEGFEDDYIALLEDTGRMSVEELAMKHLQIDLTKPDFWEGAIELCIEDVEAFLKL